MACLDDNVVLAYVEHRLVAGSRPEVEAHLDTCATCLALTCAVARSLDTEDAPRVIAARYRLQEMIGQGATASVYAAIDLTLGRRIALKLVHIRSGRVAERLSREARAMAQVKHPNVVAVYDAGALDDETMFIAMELIDGETLQTWQKQRERREVIAAYAQAGRGLAAAHRVGIVHRDFKPANVLIDREGRVAVTDFGLAFGDAADDSGLGVEGTRGGAIVGTPRYMAPEQLAGAAADERSDQFSFAASLYEGVYGAAPFPGGTVDEIREAMQRPLSSRRDRVHRTLARALERRPEDRHAGVGTFVDALEARPKRGWLIAAAAAVAIAAIAFVVLRRSPAPVTLSAENRLSVFIAPFNESALDAIVGSELARSPFVDVSAGPDLFAAATALGGTTSDIPGLVKLADERGKQVVLFTGEVTEVDGHFEIVVEGEDPRIGAVRIEETADRREDLPAVATSIGRQLREHLGETVTEPTHVALSSSLDAIDRWADGQRLAIAGNFIVAADRYRAALAIDPEFTEARQSLGLTLYNLSKAEQAATEMKRAIAGADRMGERQRLTLLGDYYGSIGKYAESIAAYEQLLARWPRDTRSEINVTGTAIDAGSWPLAYELAQRAVAHHPKLGVVHGNLLLAQIATGRLDEAIKAGDRMRTESEPTPFALVALATAHALQGDLVRARVFIGQLETVDPALHATAIADLETYAGKLDVAEAGLRAYLAKNPDDPRHATQLAQVTVMQSRTDGALDNARRGLADGSLRLPYVAAQLLLRSDTAELAKLAETWVVDPLPDRRYFGHLLRGDLALAAGSPASALAAYAIAEQHGNSWVLHARRAAAHEAAGDLDAAMRELTWCHEHRGELAVFMTPSLALVTELERNLARVKASKK